MEISNLILHGRLLMSNGLVRRAPDSSSGSKCGPNPCEKPISSSTFTLPIILGVAVPLLGAAILFMILQRRHMRKIREEDANDLHASLDFGLEDVTPQLGRSKRAEAMSREKEKSGLSRRQVSMDMTINNTYFPSIETKNARGSLDSLSQPLRKEDPYRPISQLNSNETAHIRQHSRRASENNAFNYSQSRTHEKVDFSSVNISHPQTRPPKVVVFPPRHNSLHYQQINNIQPALPIQTPYLVEPPHAHVPARTGISTFERGNGQPFNPQFRQPSPMLRKDFGNNVMVDNGISNGYHVGYGQNNASNLSMASCEKERILAFNNSSNSRPTGQPIDFVATKTNYIPGQNPQLLSNNFVNNMKYKQDQDYMIAGNYGNHFNTSYNNREMNSNCYPKLGSRPLPSSALTDTDDPEIRANRIRSFYKEYFDEHMPAPAGCGRLEPQSLDKIKRGAIDRT